MNDVDPFLMRMQETAGILDALRFVMCALVKTHPDKPALLEALREIHRIGGAELSQLVQQRLAAFDEIYGELTSYAVRN